MSDSLRPEMSILLVAGTEKYLTTSASSDRPWVVPHEIHGLALERSF